MSTQFGNNVNQKIVMSRKESSPYTNTLVVVNKVWTLKPESPMGQPKLMNKGGAPTGNQNGKKGKLFYDALRRMSIFFYWASRRSITTMRKQLKKKQIQTTQNDMNMDLVALKMKHCQKQSLAQPNLLVTGNMMGKETSAAFGL